jgi:hypothetical protein
MPIIALFSLLIAYIYKKIEQQIIKVFRKNIHHKFFHPSSILFYCFFDIDIVVSTRSVSLVSNRYCCIDSIDIEVSISGFVEPLTKGVPFD